MGYEQNLMLLCLFGQKFQKLASHLGSMEFSKQLLTEAQVAVSPGIGFGHYGDQYVRIALIENEKELDKQKKKY